MNKCAKKILVNYISLMLILSLIQCDRIEKKKRKFKLEQCHFYASSDDDGNNEICNIKSTIK